MYTGPLKSHDLLTWRCSSHCNKFGNKGQHPKNGHNDRTRVIPCQLTSNKNSTNFIWS